jgi:hypothetical protein
MTKKSKILVLLLLAGNLTPMILTTACGGSATASSSTSTTSSNSTSSNAYATAYKNVSWSSAVAVSYPSDCSMTFKTSGVPPFHNDYYLAPVSTAYPTVVAVSPATQTQMSVVPYTPSSITSNTVTVNICPAKASSTTATSQGVIGYMLSGEAIYNPYEGNGSSTPAMTDNVSYTFTTSAGVKETASF